ncbi:hypothetical protein D1P53_000799 [Cryptococcus gattii VGV]|nr:hypothetical protein D1P53_000799 [Cryptococcus gattii VGV]
MLLDKLATSRIDPNLRRILEQGKASSELSKIRLVGRKVQPAGFRMDVKRMAADRTHHGAEEHVPSLGATKGTTKRILMTSKKMKGGEELPHLYRGLFPQSVPSRIRAHVRQSTGSKKPIESPPSDQNVNLKHSPASSSDQAKGNAGEDLIFLVARVRTSGVEAKSSLLTPSSLPPHLESDYGPEANQPAPEDRKPSSGLPYSSMAGEPRHPVLTEQAKSGKLVERNPQPTAEMGRQGISEAGKHRK